MEDRTVTKMWLVRHLEVIRQLVIEDLRVVKVQTMCVSYRGQTNVHLVRSSKVAL